MTSKIRFVRDDHRIKSNKYKIKKNEPEDILDPVMTKDHNDSPLKEELFQDHLKYS